MTQGRMLIRNLAAEATVANVELPAEMTEAVETVERLEAAFNQLPATPPVDAAAAMLEDEVYTAVWAGKEVPDVRMRYAKLKVDVESATVGAQVLRGAIKRSDDRLASVFFDNVDTMLVDHLKPAHADLLSHAESLLPALEGARTERDAYAKNHGAAAAWQDLQQLAVQYGGIRKAYNILWRESLHQRTRDDGGIFAEFSNSRQINPYSALTSRTPPWPGEPTERLVWIVAGDAKPWLPTPEEQDQALADEVERNAAAMATPAMKRNGSGPAAAIRTNA